MIITWRKIIDYLKKMISDDPSVGSKRFVGLASFGLVTLSIVVALCGGTILPEFMFIGLLSLISACFAMNMAIALKKPDNG
jgi:hypothetical protein